MKRFLRMLAAAGPFAAALVTGPPAVAQKSGGILRVPARDSAASLSIHEESTIATLGPMMAVFNNLVIFDQHVAQNSPQSIIPDLATSWTWGEDSKELTFQLRQGVKWHDDEPFTANDVKCTWDLVAGKAGEKLRLNPRKSWYRNLDEVTVDGDYAVTFHVKRQQPALLSLLASGWSPVYPCHISPRDMRTHPIGTGPFKFVDFRSNESIKLVRNAEYWKKDRPYLDGIEYTIIRNPSTAILAFAAGKLDRYEQAIVPIPLMKQLQSEAPQAVCEVVPWNVSRDLILNRDRSPFDNPDLRRAVGLALDRQAFIGIMTNGQGSIGGVMMPPPVGIWGMPPEMLETLPSYNPDVAKRRAGARQIMERLGYGPDKRLAVTVTTRDLPAYRDVAVILIDQLKEIYIDAVLDSIDTANYYPKIMRKDYAIAVQYSESGVDDPDQQFYENYVCGSDRNYTGYCNSDVDKLVDRQSSEADIEKRRELVWEIERKLAEDGSRPVIFYAVSAACAQPYVKGYTTMINSVYNGWRMEDVWFDR